MKEFSACTAGQASRSTERTVILNPSGVTSDLPGKTGLPGPIPTGIGVGDGVGAGVNVGVGVFVGAGVNVGIGVCVGVGVGGT